MNFIKIEPCNSANGPGVRTILWCAGCSHHCKECHNMHTWDPNSGTVLSEKEIDMLFEYLSKPYIKGLTFSGGDPLYPANRETVLKIAKMCKEKFPEKDMWCWTGYNFEDISMIPDIKYIDVIVDGKFEIDKKDLTLVWRGSSNQRIIDVKKSLELNKIIKIME